jgi:adenylyl-sulfate kinase
MSRLHTGCVVLFTGLSGAGKSTLAEAVGARLLQAGYRVEILDGDVIRRELSKGLGFTHEDRIENLRRICFVARLLARHGVMALIPAIAPYREIRRELRAGSPAFLEVFVNAPLSVCEGRDSKGLYARARAGELAHFTGIDDPYETPDAPDVECWTDAESVEACADRVLAALLG